MLDTIFIPTCADFNINEILKDLISVYTMNITSY